jgi:hypothetical protein
VARTVQSNYVMCHYQITNPLFNIAILVILAVLVAASVSFLMRPPKNGNRKDDKDA